LIPALDALIDAPQELRPRLREALLGGDSSGVQAALLESVRRLSRWRATMDEVGERIAAAQRELAAAARLLGQASATAAADDPFGDAQDTARIAQAMDIAWIAGGSLGDRPLQVHEAVRSGLRDAAQRLEASAQAVQRFRHGAQGALVLSRPANAEPTVREAERMLDAHTRAQRVRKVLAEAARRGMMDAVPEGCRRELLILAAVLVESGRVKDPSFALRFAQQALAQLGQEAAARARAG